MNKRIKINIVNKEEQRIYPNDFALIQLNGVARMRGIDDDQNKVIIRYKNGVEISRKPYSPELARAYKDILEIPVVSEEIDETEEFEFDTVAEFGVTRRINRR